LLLIVVNRAAALCPPVTTRLLVDDVLGRRRVGLLGSLALFMAAAALVQAATGYALTRASTQWTARLVAGLRRRLHAHVMRLPLAYHDETRSGALVSRIMSDAVSLHNLLGNGLVGLTSSFVTAGLAFVVMARQSPGLAGVVLVGVAAFGALAARPARRTKLIAKERQAILAEVNGRLHEALGGVRVLKAYRAEEREDGIFGAGMDRLLEKTSESVEVSSRMNLWTTGTWGLVGALVIYIGARQILAGQLTLGGLFTFSLLLGYMAAPALQAPLFGSMLVDASAALENMQAILGQRPEAADPRRTLAIGAIRGDVIFEQVDFAYRTEKPVLHDVSFRAEPGTVTALCGPSGAGKSTILGLIASFHVPTAGTIRVDGTDLAQVRLDAYREQLGVVLQETFLFAGSILDNIALARPGATRDEVMRAARAARVDDFAARLERGYDTPIGERGVRLSGGQRQRISIARAFLADPRILILDEATSSLDANSEARLQEALAELLVGRTTFVIAHRLSTIQKADQILVIDDGRIVERGTHETLRSLGGLYGEMHARQHRSDPAPRAATFEGEPLGDA
jgi:subfamily B ATP-binding cassette protein MsbA